MRSILEGSLAARRVRGRRSHMTGALKILELKILELFRILEQIQFDLIDLVSDCLEVDSCQKRFRPSCTNESVPLLDLREREVRCPVC